MKINSLFSKRTWFILVALASINLSVNEDLRADDGGNSARFSRLFTTLDERIVLDRIRNSGSVESNDLSLNSADVLNKKRLELQLQGLMIRSDGRHVMWVNGQNTMASEEVQEGVAFDIRNISNDRLQVPVKTLTSKFMIRPGQVWLEDKDKIIEGYQHQSQSIQDTRTRSILNTQVNASFVTPHSEKEIKKAEKEIKKGGLEGVANTFNKERRQAEINDILKQGK